MLREYYNEHLLKLTAHSIVSSTPIEELKDAWFSFNDDISLNVWTESNSVKAAIYDVVDGKIVTDDWKIIFEKQLN